MNDKNPTVDETRDISYSEPYKGQSNIKKYEILKVVKKAHSARVLLGHPRSERASAINTFLVESIDTVSNTTVRDLIHPLKVRLF